MVVPSITGCIVIDRPWKCIVKLPPFSAWVRSELMTRTWRISPARARRGGPGKVELTIEAGPKGSHDWKKSGGGDVERVVADGDGTVGPAGGEGGEGDVARSGEDGKEDGEKR